MEGNDCAVAFDYDSRVSNRVEDGAEMRLASTQNLVRLVDHPAGAVERFTIQAMANPTTAKTKSSAPLANPTTRAACRFCESGIPLRR